MVLEAYFGMEKHQDIQLSFFGKVDIQIFKSTSILRQLRLNMDLFPHSCGLLSHKYF